VISAESPIRSHYACSIALLCLILGESLEPMSATAMEVAERVERMRSTYASIKLLADDAVSVVRASFA
jgi:hypothetical protein